MLGDLILSIKKWWKQFICIHEYVYKELPADCSFFRCKKCGRIKKEFDYDKE